MNIDRTRTIAAAVIAALALAATGCGSDSEADAADAGAATEQQAAAAAPAKGSISANEASEDDLKTIPGVGDELAHEIEEYRPYDAETGPAKFREEMAKYIDADAIEEIIGYLDFAG